MKWVTGLFELLWAPPEQGTGSAAEISERDKPVSLRPKKSDKAGLPGKIRLAYLGEIPPMPNFVCKVS
ncbi:hypothetical protein GWK75_01390 [Candidatus Saccharibacteria bacterium oral taxon 955]|nr:hypothetical protein GWK75_01390 [Candidatus Saccharibacteria bacterium oral taxon 955]